MAPNAKAEEGCSNVFCMWLTLISTMFSILALGFLFAQPLGIVGLANPTTTVANVVPNNWDPPVSAFAAFLAMSGTSWLIALITFIIALIVDNDFTDHTVAGYYSGWFTWLSILTLALGLVSIASYTYDPTRFVYAWNANTGVQAFANNTVPVYGLFSKEGLGIFSFLSILAFLVLCFLPFGGIVDPSKKQKYVLNEQIAICGFLIILFQIVMLFNVTFPNIIQIWASPALFSTLKSYLITGLVMLCLSILTFVIVPITLLIFGIGAVLYGVALCLAFPFMALYDLCRNAHTKTTYSEISINYADGAGTIVPYVPRAVKDLATAVAQGIDPGDYNKA